jgi:hypothetical protein
MSDAEERVPTGGELTLFEAVGRLGPDFLLFCRSSPVGDVWRDLIDAWQRPPASRVRQVSVSVEVEEDEIMIGSARTPTSVRTPSRPSRP